MAIHLGGFALLALASAATGGSTFIGYQKTDVSDPVDWGMIEIASDPFDGSSTRISTSSFGLSDLTFDADGTLWAQNNADLATVDIETGEVTAVGYIEAPSNEDTFLQVQDMAFRADGALYATGRYLLDGAMIEGLYTIDTETAVATVIAEGGYATYGYDAIAFTSDGRLIAAEIGSIREIAPDSGETLASLDLGINDILSLAVDPATGLGYAVGFSGAEYNALYELDFDAMTGELMTTLDEKVWDLAIDGVAGVGCAADLDGSGAVDVEDLLILISGWGQNAAGGELAEPVDIVNTDDLLVMLSQFACVE